MFLKHLKSYRSPKGWLPSADELGNKPFIPCASNEAETTGWSPQRNEAPVYVLNGHALLTMTVERRLLPASVIQQAAADRMRKILEDEGRKVGRKEMRDIKEALAVELLPRAFPVRKHLRIWIDSVNGFAHFETGSDNRAEDGLQLLRQCAEGVAFHLIKTVTSPSALMASLLVDPDAAANFTVDRDCVLTGAEHNAVRYKNEALDCEEITRRVSCGMFPASLALTYNDRASFVLSDTLALRSISLLDVVKESAADQAENEDERFDCDFTLMAGEYGQLFNQLIAELGGIPE
jgi:recombination associated protein RdgC